MKRCTVEHLNFTVRQQNSGVVEDFILPYSAVFIYTNPKVKELLKSVYIFQSYRNNNNSTDYF